MKQKLLLSAFGLCLLVGVFGCGSPKLAGTGSGGTGDERQTPRETASDLKLPEGWLKVTIPEGPFEVVAPAKTSRQVQDFQPPDRWSQLYTYFFGDDENSGFLLTVTSLPTAQQRAHIRELGDGDYHLKSQRDSGLRAAGGKIIEDKEIKFGTWPGREYLRTREDARDYFRTRLYFISDRRYELTAFGSRQYVFSAEANTFLDSFKLLPGPASEPKTVPKGDIPKSSDPKPESGEWIKLFNGKDLDGWVGQAGVWQVKDGAIAASSFPSGRKENTFLCTEREFLDFELEFDAKLTGNNNSGVMIRSKLVDTGKYWTSGIKVDLGGNQAGWGGLVKYDGRGGGVLKAAGREAAKAVRADDFNHMSIRCVGKQIIVKVNDVQVQDTELRELDPSGVISFQLHHSNPTSITIKDIRLREIR